MKTVLLRAIVSSGLFLLPDQVARAAEPTLDSLAEQVARLRGEIEILDARLDEQKESRRSQLRALATQKSAMEMDLQREELRAKQLTDRLARLTDRAQASGERQEVVSRAVLESIAILRKTLDHSIPFQVKERTETLDTIKRELEAATLQPTAAIGRIWEWVDVEIKLSRENELGQQVILLDGKEVLADVARLGMVALYFRASENRYGVARKNGGGWTWEVLPALENQERIAALFAALEKDHGRGLFVLPGAMNVEMLGAAK
jgi:hypothetical protein